MSEEGCARVEVALHQRLADEDIAREIRIVRGKGHAAVHVDRQAIERAALERHHLATLLFPMRIATAALEQMAADFLEPARFDARHRAREKTRGLHQLRRHDPLARLPGPRTRMHPELDAAR